MSQNKSFAQPYTPELNGIAQRVNHTMVEAALSMLIQASLPSCLRPIAVKHTIYVRNRVPHSVTGKTLFLVMDSKQPSLKHIRVFGCATYVLRQHPGLKSEFCALKEVYSEKLERRIYKALTTNEDGISQFDD